MNMTDEDSRREFFLEGSHLLLCLQNSRNLPKCVQLLTFRAKTSSDRLTGTCVLMTKLRRSPFSKINVSSFFCRRKVATSTTSYWRCFANVICYLNACMVISNINFRRQQCIYFYLCELSAHYGRYNDNVQDVCIDGTRYLKYQYTRVVLTSINERCFHVESTLIFWRVTKWILIENR